MGIEKLHYIATLVLLRGKVSSPRDIPGGHWLFLFATIGYTCQSLRRAMTLSSIRPFHVNIPEESLVDLRLSNCRDAVAGQGVAVA